MAKALLLFVLSAFLTGSAVAQTSGSVSLSNQRFDLVDLDLNDGVAPSLVFFLEPLAEPSSTRIIGAPHNRAWYVNDHDHAARAFDNVASSIAVDFGSGSASVEAGPAWQLDLHAAASVHPARAAFNAIDAQALACGLNFILSPMTTVTFRTDVTTHASTVEQRASSDYSRSRLHAGIAVYPVPFEFDAPWWKAVDWNAVNGQELRDAAILELTISNPLGMTQDYRLELNVSMDVLAQAAAVPEPSAWAMLLAGLVLFGYTARARHGAMAARTTS